MAHCKHWFLLLSVFIVCAALTAGSTQAFYTVKGTAHNVITTGDVDVSIHETTTDGKPFPEGGLFGVMPGTDQEKQVTVVNDDSSGRGSCWVRARVGISITASDGTALDNVFWADQSPHTAVLPDYNTSEWLYDNGWYYYRIVLAPGKQSEPLFTKVHFDSLLGNIYQGCQAQLTVLVQAVQAENHPLPPGGVTQLTGWPADDR